jgi:hypothetical protein
MGDPIDNILGMLNRKGGIDPAAASKRKAGMKQQRTGMGAGVAMPPQGAPDLMSQLMGAQTQVGPSTPLPEQASPEAGMEGMGMAPETMMPVIIDALNETIIALKVEIHRSRDAQHKKDLERQANKIRKQIVELGGDPIYADESIEEGKRKLTGMGVVGQDAMGSIWGSLGIAGAGGTANQGLGAWSPSPSFAGITGSKPGGGYRVVNPTTLASPNTGLGMGTLKAWDEQVGMPAYKDWMASNTYTPNTGQDDFLSQLMRGISGGGALPAAPTPSLNIDALNQMIADAGLGPRSPEEIQQIAQDIVDRQKFGQQAVIEKQLARFEANWPNEFEKAKAQMKTAAAEVKAENQEEMAARGMYYSSIMAGNLGAIDEQTLGLIGDIAAQAAEYVAGLNHDMKDLEQWAVLEQAVVERQLEEQDRNMQLQLLGMKTQVMMFADQFALDVWGMQTQAALEQQKIALQGAQVALQAYAMNQEMTAYAHMVNDPTVQGMLKNMGVDGKYFSALPLGEQSALIQSLGFINNLQSQQLQNQLVTAELFIQQMTAQMMRDGMGTNDASTNTGTTKTKTSFFDTKAKSTTEQEIGQSWNTYIAPNVKGVDYNSIFKHLIGGGAS